MKQRGLTLVELMVTIAVLAILLTIGAPSLSSYLDRSRATATANAVLGSLHLTRSTASQFNTTATLCPGADVECGTDWSTWRVATSQITRTGTVSTNTTVTGPIELVFNSSGSINVTPGITTLQFVVSSGNVTRCINVLISGAAKVEDCI